MTTPSAAKAEYPTIFVPSSESVTETPAQPASNSEQNPTMTTEGQRDPGWFTSFTGAQTPNEDNSATPSTFNAQNTLSWLGQRYRPWSEFFNTRKFGLPKLDVAAQRLQHNLSYFLSNYLCISVVLLVYCILTSFVLLLALIALAGLFYTIRQKTLKGPVVVAGNELPPSLLYSLALMAVIPLFYLSDAGGVIGWVVGTSIFLIILHAILYASEPVPGEEFEVVTVA